MTIIDRQFYITDSISLDNSLKCGCLVALRFQEALDYKIKTFRILQENCFKI